MDRNRYGLSRSRSTRPTLPVIVVVCDDSRTAPAYFTEVKRQVKRYCTLKIVAAACDSGTPAEVVKLARGELRDLHRTGARDDEADARDSVWALIDLETAPAQHGRAYDAKGSAEAAGIHIALSKPCFEVWTLAHLVDTGECFEDCSAVLRRLRAAWSEQFGTDLESKAQADYARLMPMRDVAVQRARSHAEATDPSWTEVYKLIEAINALVASSSQG